MSTTAALPRSPHRGWSEERSLATNAIIALLIAVVGLLAAGSFSLTTSADVRPARPAHAVPTAADPVAAGRSPASCTSPARVRRWVSTGPSATRWCGAP